MAGEGDIQFNAAEGVQQYNQSAAGVSGAAGAIPGEQSNLGNTSLSDALKNGEDNLKEKMGKAGDALKRGKDGLEGLEGKAKENEGKFKGDRPSGGSPSSGGGMPSSGGGSPSGGSSMPQMSSPQSSPSSQMPQMPQQQPQQQQPSGGPKTTVSKAQLAGLLNGAGINQDDVDRAKSGNPKDKGKDNLKPSGVEIKKTGMGILSKSQMHAVIDKALDNNGISRDKDVRAKWHNLLFFQAQHESSYNPDAALPLSTPVSQDRNNVGPILSDGHRAQASRGLWQTIPTTFAANHIAGTSHNIYDPVANGSAAVKYILTTYHVEPGGGPNFNKFAANRHAGGYTGY